MCPAPEAPEELSSYREVPDVKSIFDIDFDYLFPTNGRHLVEIHITIEFGKLVCHAGVNDYAIHTSITNEYHTK